MNDDLLKYYNRELSFLRHMGAEFAKHYPKVAGRLAISEDHVEDPHVSRLLEGVSLLTAQIRQKLDDSFPELTEAMMGQLYPDYHAPIPSMSIIKLSTDNVVNGMRNVPVGTEVKVSTDSPDDCYFRTCYETKVLPVEVTAVSFENAPYKAPNVGVEIDSASVLKVSVSAEFDSVALSELPIDSLRFYIHGQPQLSAEVYQLIFQSCVGIAIVSPDEDQAIEYVSPSHLKMVGFGDENKVVPYQNRSFSAYRLLVEYFLLPEKFMFFELTELDPAWLGDESEVELYFFIDGVSDFLEKQLSEKNILLGCVPIVNLFERSSRPLYLEPFHHEHKLSIAPFKDHTSEVVRVKEVTARHFHDEEVQVTPFYATNLPRVSDTNQLFWTQRREHNRWAGGHEEPGVDTFLTIVDGQQSPFNVEDSMQWVVSAQLLCSNRNVPAQLPFGEQQPRLSMRDFKDSLKAPHCLLKFTKAVRPVMFDASRWQLTSHLTLNHFTSPEATGLLKALIQLYDFEQSPQTKALAKAIKNVEVSSASTRVVHHGRVGFVSGSDIVVEFVSEELAGTNLFFFGGLLSHFFAQYTTINSFSRLTIKVTGAAEPVHQWPAMAGGRELL
ncbi:type VI secretion system baseplate subunit TssF [Vibrio sp. SCSIO 43136]|uniref:type VI secretion system baseplate subunit TssF n=1 Tax=Vibrio sp. SCSIO 43136 TaxID=2819101 RepID=UPI0020751E35|nr:type VI secretion system baseplate subunit TssF [Vibrio sp. SCSIO 43136]USD67516.1 type VI secretion system baseplate subunit TssF [Vibrio sp. SCSIO 43136]